MGRDAHVSRLARRVKKVLPMLATAHAGCLIGIDAHPVQVEVQVGTGLPGFDIVGLPERGVRESRVRVKSALQAFGFKLPPRQLVLNLAPGDLRKTGAGYDLAIAVAVQAACETVGAVGCVGGGRGRQQLRMQRRRGGEDTRMHGLRLVEPEGAAGSIGDLGPGLDQQQDGRGDVPVVGAPPGEVAVIPTGRHQGQLVGNRAQGAQHRGWDQGLEVPAPALEPAGHDMRLRKARGSGGAHGRAVARGTLAADGLEQLVGGGVVDQPQQRPAILHQRHADGELGHAAGERLRAVDRVDHPDPPAGQPHRIVLGFLGEPGGVALAERPAQETVDGEIGFRHQLAGGLLPALVRLAEVAHGDRAGLAHRGAGPRQLLGQGVAHVPATVSPSIRTVGASVLPRISRSEAGTSASNIRARLPATVTSLTG